MKVGDIHHEEYECCLVHTLALLESIDPIEGLKEGIEGLKRGNNIGRNARERNLLTDHHVYTFKSRYTARIAVQHAIFAYTH